MVEKTKHSFVDDNPYLVYAGEVDTSIDGGSGGSGGSGGLFIINLDTSIWDWTSSEKPVNKDKSDNEIMNAISSGKQIVLRAFTNNAHTGYVNLYFDRFSPGSDMPVDDYTFTRFDFSGGIIVCYKAMIRVNPDVGVYCLVTLESVNG